MRGRSVIAQLITARVRLDPQEASIGRTHVNFIAHPHTCATHALLPKRFFCLCMLACRLAIDVSPGRDVDVLPDLSHSERIL